jgi:DNA adenine methylase
MSAITGPVLKYPGSKWRMANWIINHMPPHSTYLEPFAGSLAVFFNKTPCTVETINDLDGNIINFFKVLRERPQELAELVSFTPWSRKEYESLLTTASDPDYFVRTGDELEDARRLLIRMWMGRGSKTSDRSSWRHNIQAPGSTTSRQWKYLPRNLLLAAERLKDAQIECQPAVKLIKRYKFPDVLIYADPPYPLVTRSKRIYKHEMDDSDHLELLDTLDEHPGPVLLSGYVCQLYDERLHHWERKTAQAWAEGGAQREEVLWLNPVAAREIGKNSLFWGDDAVRTVDVIYENLRREQDMLIQMDRRDPNTYQQSCVVDKLINEYYAALKREGHSFCGGPEECYERQRERHEMMSKKLDEYLNTTI